MMIYMGEVLVDWEAELLTATLIDHDAAIPETLRRPLFIEQDFSKE